MINNPLIRPYFLGGGGIRGVPLDSHDQWKHLQGSQNGPPMEPGATPKDGFQNDIRSHESGVPSILVW